MGNTCIPWQIHFDIWQNQYNIVKLKNKIKFKKKQIVNAGDGVQSLGWEDPPKKEMATHQLSCLGNPMERGAWQATVHGVTKSQIQTK